MNNKTVKVICFTYALLVSGLANSEPLFPNSVASNDIDFILKSDSSVPAELALTGNSRRELPDRRTDVLFDNSAYVFNANYADDTAIEILVSSAFTTQERAAHYAQMLLNPVGKLPHSMREKLAHVVILKGNEAAFGEHLSHFFVLYSENMEIRYGDNDLDETVFHESVHATLDEIYLRSEAWLNAQQSDNAFITEYAENNPNKEDLAESALFAYTYIKNPDRLPPHVKSWVEKMMPGRLDFFKKLVKAQS